MSEGFKLVQETASRRDTFEILSGTQSDSVPSRFLMETLGGLPLNPRWKLPNREGWLR